MQVGGKREFEVRHDATFSRKRLAAVLARPETMPAAGSLRLHHIANQAILAAETPASIDYGRVSANVLAWHLHARAFFADA